MTMHPPASNFSPKDILLLPFDGAQKQLFVPHYVLAWLSQ